MKQKHCQTITVLYVAQFVACVSLSLIGIEDSDSEEMFTVYPVLLYSIVRFVLRR